MPPPPFFDDSPIRLISRWVLARPADATLQEAFKLALRGFWQQIGPAQKKTLLSSPDEPVLEALLDFLDPEKAAYLKEIQRIEEAKKATHLAFQCSKVLVAAGQDESAYNNKAIMKQTLAVLAQVNEKTKSRFDALGTSESERILAVECKLRALLWKALKRAVKRALQEEPLEAMVVEEDIFEPETEVHNANAEAGEALEAPYEDLSKVTWSEGPAPLSPKEILSLIKQYLLENKAKLIKGDVISMHALTELILKHPEKNQIAAFIAWRSIDPKAETSSWPNLMVEPTPERAKESCMSTAETYSRGGLHLDEASRLIRLQLAQCVLVCQGVSLDPKLRSELSTQVVFYLSEIHRAHSSDREGDNPSCYPGTLTRLAQILRLHPEYKALFVPPDQRATISDAFFAKLSHACVGICAKLETDEERWEYFDALAGCRVSERQDVLTEAYRPTVAETPELARWLTHRQALRERIQGDMLPEVFVDDFLKTLQDEQHIKSITAIEQCWVEYLLAALVDSDEGLAKLSNALSPLFKKEEVVPMQLEASVEEKIELSLSGILAPQYADFLLKRKRDAEEAEVAPAATEEAAAEAVRHAPRRRLPEVPTRGLQQERGHAEAAEAGHPALPRGGPRNRPS